MNDAKVRVHVIVKGRVQGVWFRQSTAQQALEIGVAGWVRNREDGSVEAVFEGSPTTVNEALSYVRRGPERARVDDLEIDYERPLGEIGFVVR